MRILITGGFGYIGGRLAQHLSEAGHSVILGSRRKADPPGWLPSAVTGKTDWSNTVALKEICSGVDVVVHAAAMNSKECAANPAAALKFNGVSTATLVNLAAQVGVRCFIYLSTAHVYASPLIGTITEESCPLNLHPYATSHLAGEQAVLYAANQSNINGIVLRLSNVIGPPAHPLANCWMLLVNDLCLQAVRYRHLLLSSDGTARRDFISMDDVCVAINTLLCLMKCEIQVPVFNLGSELSPTIWDMATHVADRCETLLGYRPPINHPLETNQYRPPPDLIYRCDRLKALGFNLKNAIADEIDATLAFCENNKGILCRLPNQA